MLAHQEEDRRQDLGNRSVSPHVTPLTSDHVHIQHRNFNDISPNNGVIYGQTRHFDDVLPTNGVIYGQTRNWDETSSNSSSTSYGLTRNVEENHSQTQIKEVNYNKINTKYKLYDQNRVIDYSNEIPGGKTVTRHCQVAHNHRKQPDSYSHKTRPQEGVVYYPNTQIEPSYGQTLASVNETNSPYRGRREVVHHGSNRQLEANYGQNAYTSDPRSSLKQDFKYGKKNHDNHNTRVSDSSDILAGINSTPKRLIRNEGEYWTC